MRTAAALGLAAVLLPVPLARAWQSDEHFTVTYNACMRTPVVRPAAPARDWSKIAELAKKKKYTRSGSSNVANKNDPANWNENICLALASASADADVDAFDDDLAHTQTRYVGGVNFFERAVDATQPNVDHADFDEDPRRALNDPEEARLPPPVRRTAPSAMVPAWLDYFRRWTENAVGDLAKVETETTVTDGRKKGEGVEIITVRRIPTSAAHDDPANDNPIYPLGRLLHQVQDSCSHQGIPGSQHAFAAYWVGTNPDITAIEGRRDNCSVPLTEAFFRALAAHLAAQSRTTLVHLRLPSLGWAPLARPSSGPKAVTNRVGGAFVGSAPLRGQMIDYLYQACDQPCRDYEGPGPPIACVNTKFHAGRLKAMWAAAIGDPGGTTLFTRGNWTKFLDQQRQAYTDAQWLAATDTAWDQPNLPGFWWFIRTGEMQLPKTLALEFTIQCPYYGNRTTPFWREPFAGANNVVDPAQWKCSPNYERSYTAAPVNPAVVCSKWGRAVVTPGLQNVIETKDAPFRDQAGHHYLNYDYNCRYFQFRPTNYNKYCKANGDDDPPWTP